jgi:hypothetical protein
MDYPNASIYIRLSVVGAMKSRYLNRSKPNQMRIVTATTSACDTGEALGRLFADIQEVAGEPPDFLTVHYSSNHDADVLQAAVANFMKGRAYMGASSCLGVMTDTSLLIGENGGVGLLALWDEGGDFGSASGDISADPAADSRRIVTQALQRAGRAGEMPDLVWLSAAPGHEEEVLAGIREVCGQDALIVGGSSADNLIAGNWTQLGPDGVCRQGLAVAVLFQSGVISHAFHSGYVESGLKGEVTQAKGRRLYEIDGLPAADVYRKWTGIDLPRPCGDLPLPILAETTFNPLGRASGMIASLPFLMLIHPAAIWPDGSMDLFASVAEGDEILCMLGSRDGLIARAGRLTERVSSSLPSYNTHMAGALIVYCGGCMLGVRNDMEDVRQGIVAQMQGQPFLGVFSFGEQGRVLSGGGQHGNLMISCTAFGSR